LSLERYRTLIERYRDGDFQWTVQELALADIESVDYLSEQLPRFTDELKTSFPEWAVSDADLQAAVLLHTQVAITKSNQRNTAFQEVHWNAARSICGHIGDKNFRRQWLLALGYFHSTNLEDKPAVAALESALREFPKDAEILLALGTVHESIGEFLGRRTFGKQRAPSWTTWSRAEELDYRTRRFFQSNSRKHLNRAQSFYRKALAIEPGFVEAHLRLGRVLYHQGKYDEALGQFEWVLEKASGSTLVGLAHLFAGQVLERENAVKEAIEHYRAAARAKGDWQLVYLALSNALRRWGDDTESRKALEQALRLDIDPRNPQGGLWDYTVKRGAFADLVLQLRNGVLQ
jgi:tetratricopeptide (TPR) repeat protein